MCAHCLLPALLVLAAPLAFTAAAGSRDSAPYVTVVTKGDGRVPLGPSKQFIIPSGQCTGDITEIKTQPELQCPFYSVVALVEVTVSDYAPIVAVNIDDDLNRAQVVRGAPCSGVAEVQVRVGCSTGAPGASSHQLPPV